MSNWWDDPLGTPPTPGGSSSESPFALPNEWYGVEQTLFVDMVFEDPIIANDPYLQTLFDQAMFDPNIASDARQDAYNAMVEYLWEQYHLDFEDVFDWEDYRDWYENAG